MVQTLATLLSVGQREMALLFDLLRPEDTRDLPAQSQNAHARRIIRDTITTTKVTSIGG